MSGYCEQCSETICVCTNEFKPDWDAMATMVGQAQDMWARIKELEEEVTQWQAKCQKYIEMLDATAKDADLAYALLHRCETEMRYAGWAKPLTDNPARAEVLKDVQEFLK